MASQNLNQLLARVEQGESLPTSDVLAYGQHPDALDRLIEALRYTWAHARGPALSMVADLGRVKIPPDGVVPERPGPIVVDPTAVSYLTECLADSQPNTRRRASVTLAGLVPGDMLEERAEILLDAIWSYPNTDATIVLMGKTGSPEALRRLREEPIYSASSATDAEMARARLGSVTAEDAVLADFDRASDAEEVRVRAWRLGYVASERTTRRLAQEIRTSAYYLWHPPAERSIRIHIIEGLHLAFPREPLFWRPFIQPGDDSYYEAIERWLADRLGVTWDHPRPPFLYEHQAPMPPSPGGGG